MLPGAGHLRLHHRRRHRHRRASPQGLSPCRPSARPGRPLGCLTTVLRRPHRPWWTQRTAAGTGAPCLLMYNQYRVHCKTLVAVQSLHYAWNSHSSQYVPCMSHIITFLTCNRCACPIMGWKAVAYVVWRVCRHVGDPAVPEVAEHIWCRAYFSNSQAHSEDASSSTLQDQLFPSLGAASKASLLLQARLVCPDNCSAACTVHSWSAAEDVTASTQIGHATLCSGERSEEGPTVEPKGMSTLQGLDAEGGSASSAAPAPQLKGAWGSGSIASRLAQVQKGERPLYAPTACSICRCSPIDPVHPQHADTLGHAGL